MLPSSMVWSIGHYSMVLYVVMYTSVLLPLMLSITTTTVLAQTTTTSLLGGTVLTIADVAEYADLSLDIREITSSATGPTRAQAIYSDGMHSAFTNIAGISSLFSLKDLNDQFWSVTNVANHLTPVILYHIYGLTFDAVTDENSQGTINERIGLTQSYQTEFITSVLRDFEADDDGNEFAGEAIVALSVWMYSIDLLYQAVDVCHVRSKADDVNTIDKRAGISSNGYDEFIALYIGRDQTAGTSGTGHSLYDWTQRAGENFGFTNQEAPVNQAIQILYSKAVRTLTQPNACTKENPQSVKELWITSRIMHASMMIPMLQLFNYHIQNENLQESKLYSLSLLPQLVQCRPSLYKHVYDLLQTGNYFGNKQLTIRTIQEAYDCFGLSCDEVEGDGGAFLESTCSNSAASNLAGFKTSTDVASLARADLDIRQMRILSLLEAFGYVDYIYTYGSNVAKPVDSENDKFEFVTFGDLATSSDRGAADPAYTKFIDYHDTKNYANNTMGDILYQHGEWADRSPAQRAEAVSLVAATQILYLEIIRYLNNAHLICQTVDSQIGYVAIGTQRSPIDRAAALLIGSLEGSSLGGSIDTDDGELLWSLGKRVAFLFRRSNTSNRAIVNDEILDLLFAAKGELDSASCRSLESTTARIEKLLQIGILQNIIEAAKESEHRDASSIHISLIRGDILSRSVLPLLHAAHEPTARIIERNMVVTADSNNNVIDGAQAVAEELGYYVVNHLDLKCQYLGSIGGRSGINPCVKYPDTSSGIANSLSDYYFSNRLLLTVMVTITICISMGGTLFS